jgi:cytochrome P450
MDRSPESVPTVHYDHRDEESRNDPWPRWEGMRGKHPVLFSDAYGGFYVVSRYRDVADAARDTDAFSSAIGSTTIPEFPTPKLPPIHSDPPDARYWREIINPHFSPTKVAEYETWIRELVADVVDPLLKSARFNVPQDIGVPLTRQVILRIMGIIEAPEQLNAWTDAMVFDVGEEAEQAGLALIGFLAGVLAQRRKDPGSDLISDMLTQRLQPEDRLLTDEEILKLMLLTLGAALETTSSAISAMICYLVGHPGDIAWLRAEPGIWRPAMDEFVRWASPATCLARTARYNTAVSGCPIPAGSRVMLLYASGNHDEEEFPEPDRVILDRNPNRHLGFGMGPHRCLGSHLAKAQMALTLERLLPHLDRWRIEDPERIRWTAAVTRGMTSVFLVRE